MQKTAAAIEEAAVLGLCRDGQNEIATEIVRRHRPAWTDGAISAFVAHLMAQK